MSIEETHTSGRNSPWGIWEAGTIAVLFALPSAIHVSALHWDHRTSLDAFEWLILIVAVAAAFLLSLFSGGLPRARAFLSIGLITCFAWTVGGILAVRDTGMDLTYFILAVIVFTAQINLVPVALILFVRKAAHALGRQLEPRVYRAVKANIAAVALLDLFPVVYVLAPARVRGFIAVVWIALAATLAGVFAGIAARAIPTPPSQEASPRGT